MKFYIILKLQFEFNFSDQKLQMCYIFLDIQEICSFTCLPSLKLHVRQYYAFW